MNRAASQPAEAERLSIAGLLLRLRRRRLLFITGVLLTIAGIASYAFLATPQYRVEVKLMPRENESLGGGLQSLIGQYSGLAAMAGLSLGSNNEQESIALLKSRALFTQFADQQKLMPILFKEQWDAAAQRWRADLKHPPTMDDAWLAFDGRIRRVTEDLRTRVITLDVTWKDRQLAAAWANELVRLANEELRQRALREAESSIASFEQQLSHTDAVELRQAIYKLMEAQLNRSALARSRLEYALTVLDPATVPDARHFTSPRRFLLLLISVPLGLFVGACSVLAADFARQLFAQLRHAQTVEREHAGADIGGRG